jgi:hypothetical protein
MNQQEEATNGNDLATLLKGLTASQLTWVSARIHADSDVAACETAGIGQSTLRRWREAGVPVNDVVLLIKQDSVLLGREKLRRLVSKAVDVLEKELEGKRKMEAACEVLDRVGIVAPVEVGGRDGGPLVIKVHINPDGA